MDDSQFTDIDLRNQVMRMEMALTTIRDTINEIGCIDDIVRYGIMNRIAIALDEPRPPKPSGMGMAVEYVDDPELLQEMIEIQDELYDIIEEDAKG